MNEQRGFIQLSMMAWGAIAAGAVILALSGAVYVQTLRLTASKAEFAEFKGGVEALGRAAEKAALDQAMRDKLFKENADAENARLTVALNARTKQLRDARAGSGFVPAAPAGAASPGTASFDRAELERAVRALDSAVQGLVDEGSKATVDLNTAKAWAQSPKAGAAP